MSKLLEASEIHFAYGERPTLRGVGISLAAGTMTAIIGPNGSGKSTLIKILLGHLHARGKIFWNGKNIDDWRRRDIARLAAYLPQSPLHEPGQTVLDVLRLGRAPYWGAFGIESTSDEKVVRDVAHQLQLDDLLNRPMEEMSGGQRQRVFVGRCLAQQPRALLLDEPSTFLDLKHQIELCGLLRDLSRKQNLAVMMASHELNLAGGFADQLVVLQDGAALAAGSPGEILRPEILEPVYGIPMRRLEMPGGAAAILPIIDTAGSNAKSPHPDPTPSALSQEFDFS